MLFSFFLSITSNAQTLKWWDKPITSIDPTSHSSTFSSRLSTANNYQSQLIFSGFSDDPAWGTYGIQLRKVDFGDQALQNAGYKFFGYQEGAGQAATYINQNKKNGLGQYDKYTQDNTVTVSYRNYWGWQNYDGTGEVNWVGLSAYVNNKAFARPYTITHPLYGTNTPIDTTGISAVGYINNDSTYELKSKFHDCCYIKDINGNLQISYSINSATQNDATKGLIPVDGKYSGLYYMNKDIVAPFWLGYDTAVVKLAINNKLNGYWSDNYSAWDNFGSNPISTAFGNWTVANFKSFLGENYSTSYLSSIGISNASKFNIINYLKIKCTNLGGTPSNLSDPVWNNKAWITDPVWQLFKIYKQKKGYEHFKQYYEATKRIAVNLGQPDFLVMGNDIGVFSFAWTHQNVDVAASELNWGWNLAAGAKGFQAPPLGTYAPILKKMDELDNAKYTRPWLYKSSDSEINKHNLGLLTYFEAFANNAIPLRILGSTDFIGTDDSYKVFSKFISSISTDVMNRYPLADIGVFFSDATEFKYINPAGYYQFNNRVNAFGFYGWGAALQWLHIPWKALNTWNISLNELNKLKLLILPSVEVLTSAEYNVIKLWVQNGGKLLISGPSGIYGGEDVAYQAYNVPILSPITGITNYDTAPVTSSGAYGSGKFYYNKIDPGLPFHLADVARFSQLSTIKSLLYNALGGDTLFLTKETTIPTTLFSAVFDDSANKKRFVDLYNRNINIQSDLITKATDVKLKVKMPTFSGVSQYQVRWIKPDSSYRIETSLNVNNGYLELDAKSVYTYSMAIIESLNSDIPPDVMYKLSLINNDPSNVLFKDSTNTYGLPATYTWSFENGVTPSTSNAQNVSVQFPGTGKYPFTLTVSTSAGTKTKTGVYVVNFIDTEKGTIRYNPDTKKIEGYDGNRWVQFY
jgi:hypothetical protein